jgi:hypothetical protein
MDRKKLEKNIASNLTIDLDVEKYIEVTLLDIEQYANQRVIEELEKMPNLKTPLGEEIRLSSYYVLKRIKELKQ